MNKEIRSSAVILWVWNNVSVSPWPFWEIRSFWYWMSPQTAWILPAYKKFVSLIVSLPKERNMTVIISSHLLSEIEQMASQVGIIHHGQLLTRVLLRTWNVTEKSLEESISGNDRRKGVFMNTLSNIPKIVSIEFQKACHKAFSFAVPRSLCF